MLNDPEVWRTVSVEKYQWHPEWYEFYQEKLVEFLQKCKEHNNPEIIYREAITQFFIFKDDEVINNFRVAAKAGDMESSYIVGLLGLVNHTEGEEDAMELLCHLSKTKKIDMQACRESIMNRLMRYTISGLVTPPTLAKFTTDINFFLNCVNCEGNREWYFLRDMGGEYSYTIATWNCYEPCKWKRELYCFQCELREVYLLFNVFNSRSYGLTMCCEMGNCMFRFPKQSFVEDDRHPNVREVACCQSIRDYPFGQTGSEPSLIF
ncbi:unnamed protein product [Prunus armeniaca]|uniref:At2g35280-like TPR domain-containing protein n=1 Tax=Prunus armeniaca TaxID=36596 RepID=A0A6J5UTC4_PRUAR|nr:unnamed protein product [Prunus armeniaca]